MTTSAPPPESPRPDLFFAEIVRDLEGVSDLPDKVVFVDSAQLVLAPHLLEPVLDGYRVVISGPNGCRVDIEMTRERGWRGSLRRLCGIGRDSLIVETRIPQHPPQREERPAPSERQFDELAERLLPRCSGGPVLVS